LLKTKDDGRKKARRVAKGHTQIKGVNYEDTFAPTVRTNTLRYVIALATSRGLPIHQMDVETAFLQAPLKEDIYMKLPSQGLGSYKQQNSQTQQINIWSKTSFKKILRTIQQQNRKTRV
jgi:hypothetical protein